MIDNSTCWKSSEEAHQLRQNMKQFSSFLEEENGTVLAEKNATGNDTQRRDVTSYQGYSKGRSHFLKTQKHLSVIYLLFITLIMVSPMRVL